MEVGLTEEYRPRNLVIATAVVRGDEELVQCIRHMSHMDPRGSESHIIVQQTFEIFRIVETTD